MTTLKDHRALISGTAESIKNGDFCHHSTDIFRRHSFPKGLFNFPISAVACGDSISQNMMLLLFRYVSLPFTPPPLLWSKWLREAASMDVVNEVLKGSFSAP